MYSSHAVSKRYSKSLFLESLRLGIQDQVLSEVKKITSLLDSSLDLQEFIKNPSLSAKSKSSLFRDLLQSYGFSKLTIGFFDVVVKNRREVFVRDMLDLYLDLFFEYSRTRRITFISSYSLDTKTCELVAKSVEGFAFMKGFKASIEYKVDTSILGGFVVESDSLGIRYDSSLAGSLDDLGRYLV